ALLVADGGSVSWTGETYFEHNTGKWSGGGALTAYRGTEVSWSGTTVFEGNWGSSAGAMDIAGEVSATSANTTFRDNFSDTGGGALLVYNNCSFAGATYFLTNTADHDGGAISLRGGNLKFEGETYFSGNTAYFSGGALSIPTSGSEVHFGGLTMFTNNTAVDSGGAIWASASSSVTVVIVFASGSDTSFDQNQAGAYGGAMFLSGLVSLEFGNSASPLLESSSSAATAMARANVSFTHNRAATSGGAVHLSSVDYGLTWVNVTFASNSAEIGGAVYSITSGTFVEQSANGEILAEYPNIYIGGIFRDNTAVSGGALESAAGKDVFRGTLFLENSAAIGGALRLAGATELVGCDFVGNSVTDDGAAVVNLGVVNAVQNGSFADQVLLCEPGTFLAYDEQGDSYNSTCVGCPACSGCEVYSAGSMSCEPQFEHSVSGGYPVVLETLQIERGYWRATNTSTIFLSCYNEEACVGGVTGSPGYCHEGYSGPYCSVCTGGYAAAMMYTCSDCSDNRGLVFGVIVAVILVLLLVMIIFYLTKKELGVGTKRVADRGRASAALHRLKHVLPFHALKIIIVVWQILTQFDSVANVVYPGVWGQFLEGLSAFVGLDFGLVLSSGCFFDVDFHGQMLVSTITPLVALGLLGVTYGVGVRRNRVTSTTTESAAAAALGSVRRKHASMALLITFLVYSSVSSTVFRMFACETLDDANEYLRADYTIECDSAKHRALQVYAAFMIVVYPAGIPALYAALLWTKRDVLKDGRRGAAGDGDLGLSSPTVLQLTADLWKPYTPERYYFEVVECARRVSLTGVIVFIFPNSAAQVAVTLLLAFAFFALFEVLAPYASRADAWLSRVGYIVVFLSLFQALLLKVDVSDERDHSQEVFGGVLLVANICMITGVIAEAVMVTRFFLQ
ncbi:unnamed protein product, partial [Hapterophycus canaliculatus]